MRVSQNGNSSVQNTEVAGAKQSSRSTGVQQSKKSEKSAAGASVADSGGANAEISARGREFAKAKAVADSAPDVREEKIAELKRRIAAGKYNVDADAVAGRMVDEHIKMSGIG